VGDFARCSVWREHEIVRDDYAHWEAWTNGELRLEIEIALDDLLTGLVDAVCAALPQRLDQLTVVACRAELGSTTSTAHF
jgi:hypothetical protein